MNNSKHINELRENLSKGSTLSKKPSDSAKFMGNARNLVRGGLPGMPEWAFRLKMKITS
jgi:hypothetical protein